MVLNRDTMTQTYKWRNDRNILPFYWKCEVCSKTTEIVDVDTNKTYPCSNKACPAKLKFVLQVL